MTGCKQVPIVTNARAATTSDNDTVTVTYECLSGFFMVGPPVIVCNQSVHSWDSFPPACHLIHQNTHVNSYNYIYKDVDVWWYYLLAGILGLLALGLLGAVIWCWCCCKTATVNPYPNSEKNQDRHCCKEVPSRQETQYNIPRGPVLLTNKRTTTASVGSQTFKNSRPIKEPVKDNRIWMPHTHGVRNNNCSTK